ncbi:hypothetical protein J6590_031593 [Homalodisca vitripennis]|nr:hypothetical protein J6590_031593 [Homalodisca vitripennis]
MSGPILYDELSLSIYSTDNLIQHSAEIGVRRTRDVTRDEWSYSLYDQSAEIGVRRTRDVTRDEWSYNLYYVTCFLESSLIYLGLARAISRTMVFIYTVLQVYLVGVIKVTATGDWLIVPGNGLGQSQVAEHPGDSSHHTDYSTAACKTLPDNTSE